MIATLDVDIQAANPNMPLHPWRAYVGSPSSLRIRNVPRRVGDWHITSVKIVAAYPDGEIKTAVCVLTGGIWVGTIGGTATSGTSQNGYTVFADGVDEYGNPVTGYALGKGDITIMEADGSLNPDAPSYYVHLYDEQPENPHEGDIYPTADGFKIWQGGQGVSLGITQSQLNTALATKQDKLSQQQLDNIAAVPNKLDTANYHGDYISDADRNIINANLTCTVADMGKFVVADDNGETYTLADVGNDTWRYQDSETKIELYFDGNEWMLGAYRRSGEGWLEYFDGWADEPYSAKDLTFQNWTAHRPALATEKIATENWTAKQGFAKTTDIKNATITIMQGGETKGSFTLNQSANQTIELDTGGGGGGSGYTVTIIPHSMDGDPHESQIKIGGFGIKTNSVGLSTETNHALPSPAVFHRIEYVDVPSDYDEAYFNGVRKANQFVQLTGDTTIDLYFLACIAGGTLIPLADGTSKPIEEITYEDELIVWDFDEGRLGSAKPAWIKRADDVYYSWETKLASGKSIKTCGQHGHRFFDLGTNTWVYADQISGRTVYTLDGDDEVISSERIDGKVNFFNIITKGNINHFGNGILLGCSLENYLYPVQDMRFVKDNRALRPYSEFAGEVPEWWYNDCRYAESTASRDYLVKYCQDRLPIMLPR